jgi:hypothetical protein
LAHGLTAIADDNPPTAHGFRIVAGDQPVVLTELAFASVAGRGLGLDDLNPQTLALLETLGELVRLPLPRTSLAPHEDVVVEMTDPRWLDALDKGEIFLYGRTSGSGGAVSAFSLLNGPAIVGGRVPEPGTMLIAMCAIPVAFGRRATRRVKRGRASGTRPSQPLGLPGQITFRQRSQASIGLAPALQHVPATAGDDLQQFGACRQLRAVS